MTLQLVWPIAITWWSPFINISHFDLNLFFYSWMTCEKSTTRLPHFVLIVLMINMASICSQSYFWLANWAGIIMYMHASFLFPWVRKYGHERFCLRFLIGHIQNLPLDYKSLICNNVQMMYYMWSPLRRYISSQCAQLARSCKTEGYWHSTVPESPSQHV